MTTLYKNPRKKPPFAHAFYGAPVGVLLGMGKDNLTRALARAQLMCRWLEGILKLMNTLDQKGD